MLFRAVGSISANISEGYSRSGGKDRARFYEYALGSARESRGWFYQGRQILGERVTNHRIGLVTQIIRLLLVMVPEQRSLTLHEASTPYSCSTENASAAETESLAGLLSNIPMIDRE